MNNTNLYLYWNTPKLNVNLTEYNQIKMSFDCKQNENSKVQQQKISAPKHLRKNDFCFLCNSYNELFGSFVHSFIHSEFKMFGALTV